MSHFQDSFWVRPFVAAVLASPLPWGPGVGWCDQAAASQRLASSGHAAYLPPSLSPYLPLSPPPCTGSTVPPQGANGYEEMHRFVKQGEEFCKEMESLLVERSVLVGMATVQTVHLAWHMA